MQYNIARVESDNRHRRDVATKILTVCRQSMFGKQSSKENVAGNSELSFRSRSVAVFVPLSSSRLAEGTAPSNEGCNEEWRESEGWKGIEVWWHCSQRSLSAIYGCAREEKRREREEKEKEREKERRDTRKINLATENAGRDETFQRIWWPANASLLLSRASVWQLAAL